MLLLAVTYWGALGSPTGAYLYVVGAFDSIAPKYNALALAGIHPLECAAVVGGAAYSAQSTPPAAACRESLVVSVVGVVYNPIAGVRYAAFTTEA